ncbi:MAG: GNAT family N-acetyltransferase [Erysipelotrichaceae bacterium]|nr:GNAT family N-acetyltransferase [Erysipelotrichaceae bacterium]
MEYIEIIKEKDIHDLLEIVKVIWKEVFTPIIGESQVKYMLETYQSFENIKEEISDGHKYFILKDKNRTIGYTAYKEFEDKIYLSKIYFFKSERGKGYFNQILDYYNKFNKTIYLNVNKKNELAIKVYQSKGFKIVNERCVDIKNGYFMDDYILEK